MNHGLMGSFLNLVSPTYSKWQEFLEILAKWALTPDFTCTHVLFIENLGGGGELIKCVSASHHFRLVVLS